jgi:hypothetical protein
MMKIQLGDLVQLADGRAGKIIDIDGNDPNALWVECAQAVRADRDIVEVIERGTVDEKCYVLVP